VTFTAWGRCRSGRRWFWAAETYGDGAAREYGWEATEDAALGMGRKAAAVLSGADPREYTGDPGRAGIAAKVLKIVNAEKRRNRPPSGETHSAPVQYLWALDWWGTGPIRLPITKITPKRIYYNRTRRADAHEGTSTLGYVSREELETDTRCPGPGGGYQAERCCEHGERYSHGYPAGEVLAGTRWGSRHLFATEAAAWDCLGVREQAQQQEDRKAQLKRLKREMAAVHPDRGGSNEEFITARQRYERALNAGLVTA
jgi:hypothetical protein